MFIKNDESFVCKNCGHKVEKLQYTSRDHCNLCLYSLHVDKTLGDRQNECKGLLKPVNILDTGKKQKQIEYICTKCGAKVRNILAADDNEDTIYKIIENYAKNGGR